MAPLPRTFPPTLAKAIKIAAEEIAEARSSAAAPSLVGESHILYELEKVDSKLRLTVDLVTQPGFAEFLERRLQSLQKEYELLGG